MVLNAKEKAKCMNSGVRESCSFILIIREDLTQITPSQGTLEGERVSHSAIQGWNSLEGTEEQRLWARSIMYLRNNKAVSLIVAQRRITEVMGDQILECLVGCCKDFTFFFFFFSEWDKNCWMIWVERSSFSISFWLLCWEWSEGGGWRVGRNRLGIYSNNPGNRWWLV